MHQKNPVFSETLIILIGEVICVPLMLGVFTLLGNFDRSVLLGGILGGALTVLNFFLMGVGVSLAADRAEGKNVKGAKSFMSLSMAFRFLILFLVLFAAAKSTFFDPLALVIPLLFQWPIMALGEFFRKSGDKKA